MTGSHYCLFDTALGVCGIAWSQTGLTRLQLPEASRSLTESRMARLGRRMDAALAPPPMRTAMSQLQGYATGKRIDFDGIPLDLGNPGAFDLRVYDLLRTVGWGTTTTYGALAALAGSPGAARAVGRAMAKNRIPVIIPCHRVLASGDRIGGFSAYGGVFSKERLLALEGVVAGMPLLSWGLGG